MANLKFEKEIAARSVACSGPSTSEANWGPKLGHFGESENLGTVGKNWSSSQNPFTPSCL